MDAAEVAAFEASPYCEAACRLRRWDDVGKDPDAPVPELDRYRAVLEAVSLPASESP
jgi:predicted HD phosphohydrolase